MKDLLVVDSLFISTIILTETDVEFGLKCVALLTTIGFNIYKFKKTKKNEEN